MVGYKSLIGICMAVVLAFSAFAAVTASAEQRAYTCLKGAGLKDFADRHCVTNVGAGKGTRGHTLITEAGTKITGSNFSTATETTTAARSRLKGELFAIVTEVQCEGVNTTGELTNAAASVSGMGTIAYTQCAVYLPEKTGCVVKGGGITTKELLVTTEGQAAGTLLIKPSEGTEIARFEIEGCIESALVLNNRPIIISGSFIASTSGATVTTTHEGTTAQNTLKWSITGKPVSRVVGLEGALTMRKEGEQLEEEGIPGIPITLT